MDKKVEEILNIWHRHFEDESRHYSEFENSDIEYFVGCMLYNNFAFTKALDNLKTMDLSYDFLSVCEDEYETIEEIIATIKFDNELEALQFLQEYITAAQAEYKKSERYLLDRLEYHVNAMAERYRLDVDVERVDFENPLLRK